MSNLEMLVEGLIVLTVALVITVIVIYYFQGTSVYKGPKAIYPLNENSMVLSSKELPWTSAPCAIRFGIYVERAPKTVIKVDCQDFTPPATVTKIVPSCTDYSYKPCDCQGATCSACSLENSSTSTYLSKLLKCGDYLELWASGYTNQNDKPYVPALLKIRTAKSSTEHFMETVSLPAIPLQRWTIVTIVKEGRRFDVFYGAKSVASKMLNFVPASPDGSHNWFAGNSGWQGKIGFFLPVNQTWNKEDVEKDVMSLVNTRGVPYYLDQLTLDFEMPDTSCIFGNCNKMPDVKPRNPFAVWKSSVS